MRNLVNLASTVGVFVLAATPLLAVGGAAHAQEADRDQTQRISVADLDLGRPADLAVFGRRVGVAADRMCQTFGPVELSRRATCERAVHDEAYAQVRVMRTAAVPVRASAWSVARR